MSLENIGNITPEFLSMIKRPDEKCRNLNYLLVKPVGPSIGFELVSSAIKASGRNVFTFNVDYKQEPMKLLRKSIIANEIDVVMTSGVSVHFWDIKEIIDTVKSANPNVTTIVGGGIISADPIVSMEALETVDYGVIGEGEIAVCELAYALETGKNIASVGGVVFRHNEKWMFSDKTYDIPDINILPFQDYDGFDFKTRLDEQEKSYSHVIGNQNPSHFSHSNHYTDLLICYLFGTTRIVRINGSRSCPYKCTFCFHTCGDKLKLASNENLMKQIDWVSNRYSVNGFALLSEVAFVNRNVVIEFCRMAKQKNIKWGCSMRADNLDEEILSIMLDSGCPYISIGIESADNNILKSMRKNITIEQIEKVLDVAERIGMHIFGNLILGDINETVETFWNSVDWWRNSYKKVYKHHYIRLFGIQTYPGSPIYRHACNHGIIKDRVQYLKDGNFSINISRMSDEEHKAMLSLCWLFHDVVELTNITIVPQDNYTIYVTAECPHCSGNIRINNHEDVFAISPQACPFCDEHINLNIIQYCDLQKMNDRLSSLIDGENVAVWAVTPINYFWLFKLSVLMGNNVKFLNSAPVVNTRNGVLLNKFGNKEVYLPEIIDSSNIDTIFVPNRTTVLDDIKKLCAERFPQIKKIVHITELI